MDAESNNISEDPRLLGVIANMAGEIEKMEGLPKALSDLDNRLSALEKQSVKEESNIQKLTDTDENTTINDLELKDIRISELESQLVNLESSEYRENVILEWLSNLDQNSYYELGVRKGYLEEINPENQPPLGDLKDPSPEVIFSQETPEDLTGWAYSKTLDCYVRLEGGMEF
jgi:hypothetical protein